MVRRWKLTMQLTTSLIIFWWQMRTRRDFVWGRRIRGPMCEFYDGRRMENLVGFLQFKMSMRIRCIGKADDFVWSSMGETTKNLAMGCSYALDINYLIGYKIQRYQFNEMNNIPTVNTWIHLNVRMNSFRSQLLLCFCPLHNSKDVDR